MAICSLTATSASAQFFHRKGDKPVKEARKEKPAPVKEEKQVRVKVEKQAVKTAPQVSAPADNGIQQPEITVNKKKHKGGDAELMDTQWMLMDISGKSLNLNASAKAPYIYLSSKHHQIGGNTGCNAIGGQYTFKHNDIKFTPLTTKMACNNMKYEQSMMEALNHANRYMLNGQNLLLYNDNFLLAIFEAKE